MPNTLASGTSGRVPLPVREWCLRQSVFWVLSLLAGPLFAAPAIDGVCPGASAVLASTSFPLEAPPDLSKGTVEVELTVRADGSTTDLAIHSSTHPSLEATALQALSLFSCAPQASDIRIRLPIDFLRPFRITTAVCPNYDSVMSKIEYPSLARNRGIGSGTVIVDFPMQADGSILEFRIVRSTHGAFTAAALLALAQLKCDGIGRDIVVRVPFGFRLQ